MLTPLEQAKDRLRLPNLMRLLGVPSVSIPSADAQAVPCPFPSKHRHRDSKPSFNVYKNGTRAHCFACGFNLDGPGFVAIWKNLSNRDACREFIAMAEGVHFAPVAHPKAHQRQMPAPLLSRVIFPPTWVPTADEIEQIVQTRAICADSVRWAVQLGVLKCAKVCESPSWLLSDASGYVAEARRLDGGLFPAIGELGERKAHTLKGSTKSWPVGVDILRHYPGLHGVMLVEGGPDYLAALHFLFTFRVSGVLPIALLGRGAGTTRIHPEALRLLAGKHIRIYPHNDPDGGGQRSAHAWSEQLRRMACNVDRVTFEQLRGYDGRAPKDLNDLTSIAMSPNSLSHHLFS